MPGPANKEACEFVESQAQSPSTLYWSDSNCLIGREASQALPLLDGSAGSCTGSACSHQVSQWGHMLATATEDEAIPLEQVFPLY